MRLLIFVKTKNNFIESVDYEIYSPKHDTWFSEFLNKNFPTNTDRKVQSNIVKKVSADVYLQEMEILKFTGELTKWQAFIDLHETTINSSSNLSNIKKFNYPRC